MPSKRRYNPITAFVLAIFLGYLGVDRFYTGNVVAGLVKLFTLGGFGIWWLIDIVLFLMEAIRSAGQGAQRRGVASHDTRSASAVQLRSPRGGTVGAQHVPPEPRGEGISPWSRSTTLTEVVGEYYRPESYEKIFAGMPKDGTFSNFERIAALYPDPYNPHSSGSAVAVWIDGHHAGFLASGNSARYAPLLTTMADRGQYLTMRTKVTGRFDRRQNRWKAEAGLELPEPELILPVNQMPQGEYVLIPAGRSVQVTEESRHMEALGRLAGDGSIPYAATLHAIHEVRPRSSFETVEVRINGGVVGVLSKATAEKVLPLVHLIERRGLVAVARAKVSGNSLSAEVTLNMIRSSEAEPGWIAEIENQPLAARTSDGRHSDDGWED